MASGFIVGTAPVHGTTQYVTAVYYNFLPLSQSVTLLSSAVFTVWVPVPVSPISFGILPVKEGHDIESGTVGRPTAAACNVTAAMLQDWDYTRWDYHSGLPLRAVPELSRDSYRSHSHACKTPARTD